MRLKEDEKMVLTKIQYERAIMEMDDDEFLSCFYDGDARSFIDDTALIDDVKRDFSKLQIYSETLENWLRVSGKLKEIKKLKKID